MCDISYDWILTPCACCSLQLVQFCPGLKVLAYWGSLAERKAVRKHLNPKKLFGPHAPFHVCVSSYQMVVQDESYLKRVKWQYMILDEAQASICRHVSGINSCTN